MVSRVKFYSEYRKEIASNNDLFELLDYSPKHLLTKSEISDKHIDKQVKVLNEYEEKRNAFQKLYKKKRIIYYTIVSIISLILLAGIIYCGIKLFN